MTYVAVYNLVEGGVGLLHQKIIMSSVGKRLQILKSLLDDDVLNAHRCAKRKEGVIIALNVLLKQFAIMVNLIKGGVEERGSLHHLHLLLHLLLIHILFMMYLLQ